MMEDGGGERGVHQKMMDDYDNGGAVRLRAEIYFLSHEYGTTYIVFVQECDN